MGWDQSHLKQLTNVVLHLVGAVVTDDACTVGSIAPIAWVITAQLPEEDRQQLGKVFCQVGPQGCAQLCQCA